MANTSPETDVEFWSSYRFFLDPCSLTLQLLKEQPAGRKQRRVPQSQWEAVCRSFEQADRAWREKGDEYDVPTSVRQKQFRADRLLGSLLDFVRANRSGEFGAESPDKVIDRTKQEQIEAYKEIALWKAQYERIDEATGEMLPWLSEPEVEKAILLACQANDEEFFKSLGRVLSAPKREAKLAPISLMLRRNWIRGDLPLAIFSDQALAEFCTNISTQFGQVETHNKDRITHRRASYGLMNLGAVQYTGLAEAIGPIITRVGKGSNQVVEVNGHPFCVVEQIATGDNG